MIDTVIKNNQNVVNSLRIIPVFAKY